MIYMDEADFFENILGIKLLEFQKPIVKSGGKFFMCSTRMKTNLDIDFWDMPCVKISVKNQLESLENLGRIGEKIINYHTTQKKSKWRIENE